MTGKINDGGPAFPFAATDLSNLPMQSQGMTMRDWFSGQALAGLMANPNHNLRFDPEDDAGYCLKVADALIAALEGGAA